VSGSRKAGGNIPEGNFSRIRWFLPRRFVLHRNVAIDAYGQGDKPRNTLA